MYFLLNIKIKRHHELIGLRVQDKLIVIPKTKNSIRDSTKLKVHLLPEVTLQFVRLAAQIHVPPLVGAFHVMDVLGLFCGGRLLRLRPAQRSVFGEHFVQSLVRFADDQRSGGVQTLFIVFHQRSMADDGPGRQHHLEFVALQLLGGYFFVNVHFLVLQSFNDFS